ncbi:protein NRT1/ PTR FAMILY 2.11-like [Musa acuminata AAA Group]|uniref:protein NRT1/ PTR FAMILY 2.11-like n=1 Tax=Musa acuminata AAA Group TaxID=214697 RepID=UPI0031E3E8F8
MEASESGAAAVGEPLIKHRGWKTMPFVIGNETFEKLATIGTLSNLLVYLTVVFHLSSVAAATSLNVFNGTTNLATILGAFVSDTYWGRYATLGFSSMASLLGMAIMTLTAAVSKLHPPPCIQDQTCEGPTSFQLFFLILGFGLLVIGSGGIRPCNIAFGADQFDPTTESGKKGINSFFNWYYFTLTIAVAFSSTVIIYLQSNVSWTLGFAIPTMLMAVSCVFFFVASRIYVKVKPEGSPVTSIVQVLVAAFRKRGMKLPDDPKQALFNPPHVSTLVAKLSYTDQFKFLDKASIIYSADEINPNGSAANPWKLCSIQQVEEVKCVARIIPIWSTGILYYIAVAQQTTYVVFQALQSDRHVSKNLEIPGASFTIFSSIALTVWIPLYDRIVVPLLQRVTKKDGGISLLQRMGIGIVLSIVAMFVSGLVEERRRRIALHYPSIGTTTGGGGISAMSSFWLVPQLLLLGLSEAFNLVSQLEFLYKQFPENMRSLAGSLLFCGIAIASYLSGLMVMIIHHATADNGQGKWLAQDLNEGRLELFYYFIGVIGAVNFIYFIACAKWYRYRILDGESH